MHAINPIWLTGMFNYYATNVLTTDQQHGRSASTTNTEVLYALESTGPQCEGYFLHWDTTTEPYGVVLKVRPPLSVGDSWASNTISTLHCNYIFISLLSFWMC